MMRSEHFGRSIHTLMLFEERANILGKFPVFRFPGGVQRSGGLFIGSANLLPAECAGCDERRQLILALGDGDGLIVGAAVGLGNLPSPLGSQPRPQFDQRHARPSNPLSSRPSRRCFGGNAPRSQLTGEAFTKPIKLNRAGVEPCAIQPLGLHRQMDMRARRIGMERQNVIVIVAQLGMSQRADSSQNFIGVGSFGHREDQ